MEKSLMLDLVSSKEPVEIGVGHAKILRETLPNPYYDYTICSGAPPERHLCALMVALQESRLTKKPEPTARELPSGWISREGTIPNAAQGEIWHTLTRNPWHHTASYSHRRYRALVLLFDSEHFTGLKKFLMENGSTPPTGVTLNVFPFIIMS